MKINGENRSNIEIIRDVSVLTNNVMVCVCLLPVSTY